MNNKHYTKSELEQMVQLRANGATYKEIAEMFNRSQKAIAFKFNSMGISRKPKTSITQEPNKVPEPTPACKKATLSDFMPRDMIKHLYNLGYRIENNGLVHIQKTVIDIKKIMAD